MDNKTAIAAIFAAGYVGNKIAGGGTAASPLGAIRAGSTGVNAISGDTASSIAYLLGTLHGDAVWLQQGAVGGTAEPAGCRQFPCATLAEARTVCIARGINKIHMLGTFTLDADMMGYIFEGDAGMGSTVFSTLTQTATTSLAGSVLINVNLAGTPHLASIDTIFMINGLCSTITNPIILAGYNVTFMAGGAGTYLDTGSRIYCGNGGVDNNHVKINVNGIVDLYDYHGVVEIGGMNAAGDLVHIDGTGQINESAAPACTAGTITVYGDFRIVAIGGGVTITNRTNRSILGAYAGTAGAAQGESIKADLDLINDFVDGIEAKTDLILPGTKFATKTSTSHLTSGNLFTYTGTVGIVSIIGRVTTNLEAATPQTIKLTCTPDALSATDLCATKDANAFGVGSMLSITGTLADAMIGTTLVGCAVSQASMITATCVTSGKISVVYGTSGSKDGVIVWEILWIPLTPTSTLVAA